MAEKLLYSGLGIAKNHLNFVQLNKIKGEWGLKAAFQVDLPPETLRMSVKEEFIKDIDTFNDALNRLLKDASFYNEGLAVSIPSEIVKLSLLPLNVSLMDNEEVIQTIKWKLHETVPYDTDNMRVDFQRAGSGKNGEEVVIVAAINSKIIEQVEYLLGRQRIKPKIIGISSLNHLNFYSDFLSKNDFSMILSIFDDYFFFAAFNENRLCYFRGKKLSPFATTSSVEITSTIDYYLSEVEERRGINKLGISTESENVGNYIQSLNRLYPFEICTLNPKDVFSQINDDKGLEKINSYTSTFGAAQMLHYGY